MSLSTGLLQSGFRNSHEYIAWIGDSDFLDKTYKSSYDLLQSCMTSDVNGNHPDVIRAYVDRIKRWKSESERLSQALQHEGVGLLPCRYGIANEGEKIESTSGRPGSSWSVEYDSEDVLELRSGQCSDDDEDDVETQARTIFAPPAGSKNPKVWTELNDLIGLEPVKRYLREIFSMIEMHKSSGEMSKQSLHLLLTSNPGVGKTTVARLYGQALKDLGVLPTGQLEEHTKSTLVGKYVGHTEANTRQAVEAALGGVLFIDETHQLAPNRHSTNDFGKVVIDTLLVALENLRTSFVVVFATYTSQAEVFLDIDRGLRRRIPGFIECPDYSDTELAEILEFMVKTDGRYLLEHKLSKKVGRMVGKMRGTPDFANAGSVRNAYERAQRKMSERLLKKNIISNVMKAKDFAFFEEWVAKSRRNRNQIL